MSNKTDTNNLYKHRWGILKEMQENKQEKISKKYFKKTLLSGLQKKKTS